MEMLETLRRLLNMLIPLLIIMDPLGNLGPFLALTERHSPLERRKIARNAALCAGCILVFFCLTGDGVLRFFGVGLPAFQIAGGFIFFVYALQMLNLIGKGVRTSLEEEEDGLSRDSVALVPLATPLLAGPGAITAVLGWRGRPGSVETLLMLLVSIVLSCGIVYLVFRYGTRIFEAIGPSGIRVITRILGLLLAVIAVQFMVSGWMQIR